MSKVKDWEEIEKEYYKMLNMPIRPRWPKLPEDWIVDINKSVKWNMEKSGVVTLDYEEATFNLLEEKNKAKIKVVEDLYYRFQYEVGHGISFECAKKIVDYICKDSHFYYFDEIKLRMNAIIELISYFLDKWEGQGGLSNEISSN